MSTKKDSKKDSTDENNPMSYEVDMSHYDAEFKEVQQRQEKAKERKEGGGFVTEDRTYFYEFKEGSNKFIVLPPKDSKKVFKKVHYIGNMKNFGGKAKHQCVELTYPELKIQCPLYKVVLDLENEGHEVWKHKPKARAYFCGVDVDGEVMEWDEKDKDGKDIKVKGDVRQMVQIYSLPPSLYDLMVGFMHNPDTSAYWDPNNAVIFDLQCEFGKEGNPYKSLTVIQVPRQDDPTKFTAHRVPIHQDAEIAESIMKRRKNLDEMFSAPLDELKPTGKIAMAAQMMRSYYDSLNQQKSATPMPEVPKQEEVSADLPTAPPPAEETPAPTQEAPPQQEAPAPEPAPQNPPPAEEENNTGLPACFGTFGTPAAGLECEKCLYKVVCKSDTAKKNKAA